jgi:phage tail-like protein
MDANGTRFHLLLGREDWGSCRDERIDGPCLYECWENRDSLNSNAAWDEKRHELRLASRAYLFAQSPGDTSPRLQARRGAARDRYGSWYWIAPNGREILVHSAGSQMSSHFWATNDQSICKSETGRGDFTPTGTAKPESPRSLQGLTITEHHELVVGTLDPPGLLMFDLFGGGPPVQVKWPFPWHPFDFSPRAGGGLWVLERDLDNPNQETWIWEIDRQLGVVQPSAETDAEPEAPPSGAFEPGPLHVVERHRHRTVTRDDTRQHQGRFPVAIEGLRDGTALVVDSDPAARFSTVWRYGQALVTSVQLGTEADLEANVRPEDRSTFSLLAADAAVTPRRSGESADRLHIVGSQGNQAFEFRLELAEDQFTLSLENRYLPMRLFGGMGLVATSDELPSYNLGNRWVPLIEQRRSLYEETVTVLTPVGPVGDASDPRQRRPAFDGGVPDCIWHRLMIDACIPPGTGVTIESQAVNDLGELRDDDPAWFLEPTPYLRRTGSEVPFQPPRQAQSDGTWELLFQQARGRYLVLRITLAGTGTSTPRIRAIRAYAPRFSYLEHYLPDLYRDNEDSAQFLDRYLANLEGIATGIEDRVAAAQALFDIRSAPVDTLPWLASWFGLVLDPAWDEPRRRLLIDHAMDFFAWRGTTHGLEMALRLALDACVDASAFTDPDTPPDPTQPKRPASFRVAEAFLRRVGSRVLDVVDPEAEVATEAPVATDPVTSERWQAFLKRRYRQIGALNRAHRRFGTDAWTSFDRIERTGPGDPGGTEEADWRTFQDEVVTAGSLAHRFTVLLPGRDELAEAQQERAALVRRVIGLEKPAHTVFDVAFYWSAFRVGQARLGDDSIIEASARTAFAMPPLVLNRGGLAQAYLGARNPVDICDGRQVIGQGNLGGAARQGGCIT